MTESMLSRRGATRSDLLLQRTRCLPSPGRGGSLSRASSCSLCSAGWGDLAASTRIRIHPTPLAASQALGVSRPSPSRGGWAPSKRRERGAHRASRTCSDLPAESRSRIAEPLQILPLLLIARRQLEQARGGAAQDVVLGLLRQKRQVPDPARHVEIPVRIVGGVKQ